YRLRRGHAHARLGVGEEHAVGLADAERRRIDDLVEMRAEPQRVAQVGDTMVLLVGGGEDPPAGAPPPGIGGGQHRAADQRVVPSLDRLDQYAQALRRGGFWPDNIRREVSAQEELAKIAADPAAFVATLDDREAKAGPVTLPDGSQVKRLPGYRRWMWDDGDG